MTAQLFSSLRRRSLLVLLLSGTALAGATAASAQSVDAPPVAAASTPVDDNVIIVTAQKRAQAAQDVGITLNVYSGDTLRRQGVFSAPDIAKLTPGVGVSGSFAGQNVTFSVRGVTQQDFQAQAESPIAVYLDEGYLAANNAAGIGLFDIERVEVLKGPQGTLFGRNATGGLVSITTRKPTKYLSADASVSYSSYNDIRGEAAIGGPLAENVQARVAAVYERSDGWLKNSNPAGGDLGGKHSLSLRGQLAAQPSSNVDLLLSAYYSNVRQSWGPYTSFASNSVLINGVPDAVEVPGPISFFGNPQSPSDYRHLRVDANHAQSSGAFNKISGATFHAKFDLGGAELTSITDYKVLKYKLLLDDDASAINFLDTITTARVSNWSQEVRLFKNFGRARLTTGAYYLHIDSKTLDLQRLFGLGGVQVSSPFGLKTNSASGFVQAEVDLVPKLTLQAGFRATREQKRYNYSAAVQQLDGTPIVVARTYNGKLKEWLYSWKGQLEYRPHKGLLLFAGYSRGTKAGSFNAPFAGGGTPVDADIPYKPEKLDSFEAGFKSTILDGLATLNGSAFYYDYKNYQAFKFINFSTVVSNNPATIKGFEAEFNVRPVHGLELMTGLSYVDAEVKNVPLSNGLGSTVVSRRPPFSSKWQANATARYAMPIANGELAIQGDVQYRSSFFFSLTNFQATKVRAYTLLNARVSWTTADKQWEFAAFGRNLTDRRYRTVGFEASDFGGWTQVGYGEPRWLGVSVAYKLAH